MSSYDRTDRTDRTSVAQFAAEPEVLRVAARAAEDAGDFEGALRLVRRLPDGTASSR